MNFPDPSSVPLKFHQIASLISPGSRVLDVGCGPGELAPLLVKKDCVVDGIDLTLDRLDSCRPFYNTLWARDIEGFDFEPRDTYDVVVFSDVLEHLRFPDPALEKTRTLLKPNGSIVISLPNVAYYANRLGLLSGRWEYQDEGILDRTHLRFYTLPTARNFIEQAGYDIQRMIPETPVIPSKWKHAIFSFLAKRWPALFGIGWVFHAVPRDKE